MTDDELLDQITAKWAEAGKLKDEANEAESHAVDLRYQADDTLDEADALARTLIDAHPEWSDALLFDHKDPR